MPPEGELAAEQNRICDANSCSTERSHLLDFTPPAVQKLWNNVSADLEKRGLIPTLRLDSKIDGKVATSAEAKINSDASEAGGFAEGNHDDDSAAPGGKL